MLQSILKLLRNPLRLVREWSVLLPRSPEVENARGPTLLAPHRDLVNLEMSKQSIHATASKSLNQLTDLLEVHFRNNVQRNSLMFPCVTARTRNFVNPVLS